MGSLAKPNGVFPSWKPAILAGTGRKMVQTGSARLLAERRANAVPIAALSSPSGRCGINPRSTELTCLRGKCKRSGDKLPLASVKMRAAAAKWTLQSAAARWEITIEFGMTRLVSGW